VWLRALELLLAHLFFFLVSSGIDRLRRPDRLVAGGGIEPPTQRL
jgi:hypothetical protein